MDLNGAIPEPFAIIINGVSGSSGIKKDDDKTLILSYFGLLCKNLLVKPIFPFTMKRDTISSIYPGFHPAKV